jgi:hypothetical protein
MSDLKMPLNKAQIEILKLFSRPMSEEDLQEIKILLVKHLAEKLTHRVDDISKEKGYTQEDFNSWLNEPNQ